MPLPAPYAPPWKRLGEDGVALLAWLGLKGRELWRRNGEGTLSVPAFWPRRWSRLFWPLALAAMLLGAITAGRAWLARPAPGPAERIVLPATARPGSEPTGVPTDRQAAPPLGPPPAAAPDGPPGAAAARDNKSSAPGEKATGVPPGGTTAGRTASSGEPESDTRTEEGGNATAQEATGSSAADAFSRGTASLRAEIEGAPAAQTFQPWTDLPGREREGSPDAEASPSPAEREANRLQTAWSSDDRDRLITNLSPEPAAATLTLDLDDAFIALKATQRQRQAERWQQRAAEEGYSHLRLRDGRGRLLARDALVGAGMILLEPPRAGGEVP
ncbi:MAG: hypothetical protein ACK6AD_14990 [Cyanobacteriota bacterium]